MYTCSCGASHRSLGCTDPNRKWGSSYETPAQQTLSHIGHPSEKKSGKAKARAPRRPLIVIVTRRAATRSTSRLVRKTHNLSRSFEPKQGVRIEVPSPSPSSELLAPCTAAARGNRARGGGRACPLDTLCEFSKKWRKLQDS